MNTISVPDSAPLGLPEPGRSHASPRSRRGPHPHHAAVPGVGGRRRIQRGPRPAPLLWPAHRHRHRAGRQPGRPPGGRLHPAGRRGHFAAAMGSLRRRGPHGAQRPQLYRARLRRARGGRLLRPRPHGHQPGEARRLRLGIDLRPDERLALVPYRRHLRRALRIHGRSGRGSHGRGAQPRNADLLRPELPRFALEVHRRQSQGAGSEPRDGAQGRPAAGQRRRFLRHARRRRSRA